MSGAVSSKAIAIWMKKKIFFDGMIIRIIIPINLGRVVLMSTERTRRKLSRAHFAFMRALAQGLDAKESWDRYMALEGDGADRRAVSRVMKWVREEFASAATRLRKPGTARLWRLDLEKFSGHRELSERQPTLEEFVAANNWEDFSEDEQLQAYIEVYGLSKPRKNGRERFIARQLQALTWLENQVAQEPKSEDAPSAWLSPALARKIEEAGIPTIYSLAQYINARGEGWHRNIPGVGAGKASRIVEWMLANSLSTNIKIGEHVMIKRKSLSDSALAQVVTPATAIRPMEKLIIPKVLDGSAGKFRMPASYCALNAENDYQAVEAWLHSKREGQGGKPSSTQRAYRKEVERLLLWSVLERGKAISSISVEDASAYMQFLSNPPAAWCGPRHHQRWSPLWRPIEGSLSPKARGHTMTILKSLYVWLNAQGYLFGNPFGAISRPVVPEQSIGSGRTLSLKQIEYMLLNLDNVNSIKHPEWLGIALPWLYYTGLRLQEMIDAKCSDVFEGRSPGVWLQRVIGKGGRTRIVPVPEHVINKLMNSLEKMGRPRNPFDPTNSSSPIVSNNGESSISPSGLYKTLKRYFEACAKEMEAEDPVSASLIRKASTHWLRHTHASHLVNGSESYGAVPLHIVRENLGHTSLNTTTGYISTEIEQRALAMNGFFKYI
ncbi:phage integrase family protein [Delftia sp. GW456-R20]|uniref:phage integrase family protein n=1 Tax=Delftia sp. GW456-R20 TaxID=1827145 RepID=UPI0012E9512E|nr:phage integrase family protein [Delftia sp. GW456-R20]